MIFSIEARVHATMRLVIIFFPYFPRSDAKRSLATKAHASRDIYFMIAFPRVSSLQKYKATTRHSKP